MTLFDYVRYVVYSVLGVLAILVCAGAFLQWLLRFLTEVRSWDGADWKAFILRTGKVLFLVVAAVLLFVTVIDPLERAWGSQSVAAGLMLLYVLGVITIAGICLTALVCAVAFLQWLLRFLTEVRSWDGVDWKAFILRTGKVLFLVVAAVLLFVTVIDRLEPAWAPYVIAGGMLLFAFVADAVDCVREALRESITPRWKCILFGIGHSLLRLIYVLLLFILWLIWVMLLDP